MKRMLVLMLALVMVFALCACGKKGEKAAADQGATMADTVIGRYYMIRMADDSVDFTAEEYCAIRGGDSAPYIDVNADGSAILVDIGDTTELCWGNGMMWRADGTGEATACTFSGNTLTISRDGFQMTFEKG